MSTERQSTSNEATRRAEQATIRGLSARQRLLRALSLWDDMQALRAAFVGVIPAASRPTRSSVSTTTSESTG
jgi:hypothetical protein